MYYASHIISTLFCCLVIFIAPTSFVSAQQRDCQMRGEVAHEQEAARSNSASPQRPKYRHTAFGRARRSANSFTRTPLPQPSRTVNPVAFINELSAPEYLFGQAQVTVKGKQDPIIRLGLAQNGSTVVEFPVTDNFFAIHPGSSNVVAVDESPTLSTDHYLVFRTGHDFVAPPASSKKRTPPEATISVQMQSGMFVTFMFYPVRNVAQMAHRCVVSYSREEVVAARRAVGLAVNLDGKDSQALLLLSTSKRIADLPTTQAEASQTIKVNRTANNQPQTVQPSASLTLNGNAARSISADKKNRLATDITGEAQRELQSALAAPTKFTGWSASLHGLSVSALPSVELNEQQRLVVIAIKNTSAAGVRLVAGQPDIDIETVDERGQPVQTRSVSNLYSHSTVLGGAIPAGTIAYYAIVYETPVLGATQRLRLSVAQINAADEPARISLSK